MERKNSLMSEAEEAGLLEVVCSVSHQAAQEDLLFLGSRDCPQTLVTSNIGGDRTLEAMAAAGAQEKAPKKVITMKVSECVKWYNAKCGYGFISRQDTKEEVVIYHSAIIQSGSRKYQRWVGCREAVEFNMGQGERSTQAANMTRPVKAPVKGSCFTPTCPRFSPGFYI